MKQQFRMYILGLMDTVFALVKVLLFSRWKYHKITGESRTAGECVIMGTGPSFEHFLTEHISFANGKHVFCMNDFVLSEHYDRIRPCYYIFIDPVYILAHVLPLYAEMQKKVCQALIKKTKWPMQLFVPYRASKNLNIKALHEQNANITICYINDTSAIGFPKIMYRLYDCNLAIPGAQNTLAVAIYVALKKNFTKIYIIGADHSWHESIKVNDDNLLYLRKGYHFDDQHHEQYIPFVKNVVTGETFRTHEFFDAMVKTFLPYHILNHYAQYKHSTVLNASKNSYIDAFERIDLDTTKKND